MTLTLFITLVMTLALVSSLLTEAVKKIFGTDKPTLVDAIISAITGQGGGVACYILMGIAFTPSNIVCLILLAPTIWLGSTLGYDKVIEVIKQIAEKARKEEETAEDAE